MSLPKYFGPILHEWRIKQFDNENIVYPWGAETADSDGFFSLDPAAGYRYRVISQTLETNGQYISSEQEIVMRNGHWRLMTNDRVQENLVCRRLQFEAIEDCLQMDFVMRFRFKKVFFTHAMINGMKIIHCNSNVYHQFPVHSASLHSTMGEMKITLGDYETNGHFLPELYVRDRGDEWIVHVRMMPVHHDVKIIKMCNRYMRTKSLPQWLTTLILMIPGVKKELWYRGERRPYLSLLGRVLNPNAFALGKVGKGEKLTMNVECQWISRAD